MAEEGVQEGTKISGFEEKRGNDIFSRKHYSKFQIGGTIPRYAHHRLYAWEKCDCIKNHENHCSFYWLQSVHLSTAITSW